MARQSAEQMGTTLKQVESANLFMRYLRFFRRYTGNRLYALVVISLISTNLEGLGIALFLPVFGGIGAGDIGEDPISRAMLSMFEAIDVAPTIGATLVAVCVVFLLKGIVQFLIGAYQYRLSSRTTKEIRGRILDAIGAIDYRYVLQTNTGTLTNLITTEVSRTSSAFVFFARVFPHILSVIVFFAIVLVMNWQMTLIAGAVGAILMVFLRLPNELAKRASSQVTVRNAEVQGLLIQTVQSLKYLLATSSFERVVKRLRSSVDHLAASEARVGAMASVASATLQPLTVIFLAVVMFQQTQYAGRSLAEIFVLLMYLFRMLTEILATQAEWQNFCTYVGGLDAVSEAIQSLEQQRERRGTGRFDGIASGIELRDLTFAYGEKPVLAHVDMRIPKHSMVALVGESGAGKSTLVDLLTGVLKPQSGEVLVDGKNLDEIDIASYRRRIGYLPQDFLVYEDSVFNNVTLWTSESEHHGARLDAQRAAEAAHAHEFISAMPGGYDSPIGDRGVKLSGGQRQRLSISRELFKQPDLLILDEATSALDSESERLIKDSIVGLKGRVTIVVIAHRLSTIADSDLIYVLHEGSVVESGGFKELYGRKDSRFRRMCDLQRFSGDPS
jgi:ABC-type multidrug transport system fused ATPase/permease subunit